MLPMSSAQLELAGTSRATGLPCLVIRMPSGSRLSSSIRHCSLNLDALIFCMLRVYRLDNIIVQSIILTNSAHFLERQRARRLKAKIYCLNGTAKAMPFQNCRAALAWGWNKYLRVISRTFAAKRSRSPFHDKIQV